MPAALATVVDIEGGSTSRIGARMFVTTDGARLGSLTVGGCVDGRAAEESGGVLNDGMPRDLHVRLGEDEPDFGMSCAGVVRVFITRMDVDGLQLRVFDEARTYTTAGRRAVVVTALDGRTDPFLLAVPGETSPWPHVNEAGRRALDDESSRLLSETDDHPELFLQPFVPPPLLVVVGTGPVAAPLVRLATQLGYRTCIVDGTDIEGFEAADDRMTGIPSEICRELPLNDRSAVVITAHDYKYEVPVLREVLNRDVGYVGFVASARRGGAVLKFLESTGTDPARLETVRVPVGLDVGAETPAEIAVSILSEMLAVRSGRSGGSLRVESELKRMAG